MMRWAAGAVLVLTLLWLASVSAWPQVHHHPTETITGETARFYATWNRPDNRGISCCNLKDCYATEVKQLGGTWFAKRREDGRWLPIPESKVETERDSPDGRNHLCAQPPGMADAVFCFLAAGGA